MTPDLHSFADIHTHSGTAPDAIMSVEPSATLTGDSGSAWYSVGIHPWSTAVPIPDEWWERLTAMLADPRVVAVGEAGLDKKRGGSAEYQEEVFRRQAALAEATGKPLIVHCVGRYGRLMELHEELHPSVLWVVHGFTGKPELARQLAARGIGISLGRRAHEGVESLVPDYLLFRETD